MYPHYVQDGLKMLDEVLAQKDNWTYNEAYDATYNVIERIVNKYDFDIPSDEHDDLEACLYEKLDSRF